MNDTTLADIKRVAIVASVTEPDVVCARADGSTVAFVPGLGGFVGAGLALASIIDNIVRRNIDRSHASEIEEHTDFTSMQDKMAQSFVQDLRKRSFFQHIEYITKKNRDSSQLKSLGYDAIIRLTVREIKITPEPGDYARLTARVYGEMERLNSGSKVWDREEFVINPEPHTLDYYKENGLRELDAMLGKSGRNLAYDFLYLK